MAIRLLNLIGSRAAQTGYQHLKNNHPIKAVILYEIAVKASEENKDMHKYILFDLAQASRRRLHRPARCPKKSVF